MSPILDLMRNFVPGDGGAQIEANLTGKPEVVHYSCWKTTKDYFDLWLNLESFAPIAIDCWVDNMRLLYNETSGMAIKAPGVETRIPGFGNTETVEWLDPSKSFIGKYFADIVKFLTNFGYIRSKSAWKDKFIHAHISLAGAWGGAMQIVRLFASGYNMGHYRLTLPPSKMRIMQRSFTSSAFLFPSYNVWNETEIIARTVSANYTTSNIQQFFTDMNYTIGWTQYKNSARLLGQLEAPNIEMHCIYGTGVATPEKFEWAKGYFPDYPPLEIFGDGDGTVNHRSLDVCRKWVDNNGGKNVSFHCLSVFSFTIFKK
ncbi:unnamed protein product [Anisakis simplex]|uniref:DUF2183 domain-containing protein n=1 Tax=Anisakis simplex TaxID=6269 RepID=A0A0M3K489_ANISI|nr:unnamed protein product [Anisakis simplex]